MEQIGVKEILFGVIAVAQIIGVKGMFMIGKATIDRLSAIRDHLAVLNGRVKSLEMWTEGHEQLDVERTTSLKEKIAECHQGNVRDNNTRSRAEE